MKSLLIPNSKARNTILRSVMMVAFLAFVVDIQAQFYPYNPYNPYGNAGYALGQSIGNAIQRQN